MPARSLFKVFTKLSWRLVSRPSTPSNPLSISALMTSTSACAPPSCCTFGAKLLYCSAASSASRWRLLLSWLTSAKILDSTSPMVCLKSVSSTPCLSSMRPTAMSTSAITFASRSANLDSNWRASRCVEAPSRMAVSSASMLAKRWLFASALKAATAPELACASACNAANMPWNSAIDCPCTCVVSSCKALKEDNSERNSSRKYVTFCSAQLSLPWNSCSISSSSARAWLRATCPS
mmetsp:Transcript_40485/g.128096  ORF Transcript_40485/g.128096 Transcript_40485/m.128096 type:complete len:236 (+) Transcript_40485:582-1289(+)